MKNISKSKYIVGIGCPVCFWKEMNDPDSLPGYDEATEQLFATGHNVGELAKGLFPGGVDLPTEDFGENIRKAEELVEKLPERARYRFDGHRAVVHDQTNPRCLCCHDTPPGKYWISMNTTMGLVGEYGLSEQAWGVIGSIPWGGAIFEEAAEFSAQAAKEAVAAGEHERHQECDTPHGPCLPSTFFSQMTGGSSASPC